MDCGTNASNHTLRVDRVVKALEALPDVAHLDFDGVSLGAGDLPRIVDAAGDRLATIDFEDACVPVGDLVDCCARCPHLRRLTLPCTTGCPDLERRLGDVAAAAPKLAGCIFPEDSVIGDEDLEPFFAGLALTRAGKESEIPNFKGSDLGRFPLVSADFWTSDHLSERSRSMDAFSGTRARGTLMLKRT